MMRFQLRKFRFTGRDYAMILAGVVVAVMGVLGVMLIEDRATVPLRYDTNAITISWIPDSVRKWQDQMVKMGEKYDISPNLLAIIMTMESGGDPRAHSEADAQGLMQVTPMTAGDIAKKHLKKPVTTYDLYDPVTSIEFGAAYLAWLRDEFGMSHQAPTWNETVELIAAGYNGGPRAANSVDQGKGLTDTQTVVYARDAFNMWRERGADTSPTYSRWLERGGQGLVDSANKR